MALISCPECEAQISDKAPTCPKCGAPISKKMDEEGPETKVITVQETSKRLKSQVLLSTSVFIIGLIWFIASINSDSSETAMIPFLLILIGIVWNIVTRIRIWWHHK